MAAQGQALAFAAVDTLWNLQEHNCAHAVLTGRWHLTTGEVIKQTPRLVRAWITHVAVSNSGAHHSCCVQLRVLTFAGIDFVGVDVLFLSVDRAFPNSLLSSSTLATASP
jgi:hypothetical protein